MKKRLLKWAALAALGVAVLGAGRAVLHGLAKHPEAALNEPDVAPPKSQRSSDIALSVYDGKLMDGWSDWGWGPHALPPSAGPAKVQFTGYGGIIFHHELVTLSYGGISFRYKAPADWPEFLAVSLKSSSNASSSFANVSVDSDSARAAADGWRDVWLGMDQLNPQGLPFDRIVISSRTSVGDAWVLLDKVGLTRTEGRLAAAVPQRSIALSVLCSAPSHPISPLIYGSALGDWESGQTAQRIGGNPTSRANWELGAWNVANDWFFENTASTNNDELIDAGAAHGARTALTVPMLGWVAKDKTSVGFPSSKFPGQRKYDSNRPGAGDGFLPNDKPVKPGPATETSLAAPPELIGKWIAQLRDKDRARSARSVLMYILDNEPSLWSSTHRDVHPEPLGYDELLDRTLRYATAIRAADPETPIAGPAEWGWLNYFYSARDIAVGKFLRPDRRAHGDEPLIPWYLKSIAAHEKASGTRILDFLDVHFYPAADGLFGAGARTDPEGQALRLRATRSLWDPEYKDESWIDDTIRLIPRLKEWVAANDPGLRISIGEWNFGAENDISGALATAEALGRFGQQGLDSAFFWAGPKADTATFWAFRAFRNFDGHGARFLDESVPTREEKQVSLFASRDAAHGHVVALALNRDPKSEANALLRLEGCGALRTQRAFVYGRGSTGLLAAPVTAVDGSSVRLTIPPYSLLVLDLEVTNASP